MITRNDALLGIIEHELHAARRGNAVALANLSRAAAALAVVADPDRDVADYVRLSDNDRDEPIPSRFARRAQDAAWNREDGI